MSFYIVNTAKHNAAGPLDWFQERL